MGLAFPVMYPINVGLNSESFTCDFYRKYLRPVLFKGRYDHGKQPMVR